MDTLFFLASKLFWLLFSPSSLLVWLILFAWLAGIARWQQLSRSLLAICACVVLLITSLPVHRWLLVPLEQRFPGPSEPLAQPEGIIVLGGSFDLEISASRGQVHLTGSGERILALLVLARRYPQARLVFSGGSGIPGFQEVREADMAAELFAELGLPTDRVVFERDSRNTFENARSTTALVKPDRPDNWLLVTSATHMPRAMGAFCRQGWKLRPYPVDYLTLDTGGSWFELDFLNHLGGLQDAVREWTGLIAYRITGKINRLLPGPEDRCPAPADTGS